MKYLFLTIIFSIPLTSCSQSRNIAIAKEVKGKLSSECISFFWGYDIEKRGNQYIFRDSTLRVISYIKNGEFTIDTSISVTTKSPFGKLVKGNKSRIQQLSYCAKTLNIKRVRGFDDDFKLLELIIDERLIVYYTPELKSLDDHQIQSIKKYCQFLDDHWFYLEKKNDNSPTIW